MFDFRPLENGEMRVLIGRHGAHKNNILESGAVVIAKLTGEALRDAGLKISAVYSSPSPRAIETCIHTLHGYGDMVYIRTDDDLADFAIEGPGVNARLPMAMKERGLAGEPGYQTLLFEPGNEFQWLMNSRAIAGALAIEKIVSHHQGQTVFIASHGIARIEPAIQVVKGEGNVPPPRFLLTGQIVELIFDSAEILVEENWLEPVSVPAT